MNALISGLVVAAISAITFVAYRHPSAYNRRYNTLALILWAAFGVYVAWLAGVQTGLEMAKPFVAADKGDQIAKVVIDSKPPWWVIAGFIGLYLYLLLLSFLPELIGVKDQPQDKDDKKGF